MTEITQADRDAAARWAKKQSRHAQAANMKRGSCDNAPLVQAFARHRMDERAAIVSWLRTNPDAAYKPADAIEAGEHLK